MERHPDLEHPNPAKVASQREAAKKQANRPPPEHDPPGIEPNEPRQVVKPQAAEPPWSGAGIRDTP
jgi:hypothetical protein